MPAQASHPAPDAASAATPRPLSISAEWLAYLALAIFALLFRTVGIDAVQQDFAARRAAARQNEVQHHADDHHRKGQSQHMGMIVGQQKAEGGEFVNRLGMAGQIAIEVIIGQDAAGAEPPPVFPLRQVFYQGRGWIALITLFRKMGARLCPPKIQIGRRRGS